MTRNSKTEKHIQEMAQKLRSENPVPSNKLPVVQYATGAVRGTDHAECNIALVPPEAIRAIGRAFAEGVPKYGRDNWLKGFPQSTLLRNGMEHILSYLDGDTSEAHLDHALWNFAVAAHQAKYRPDQMDLPPYRDYDLRPQPNNGG